MNKILGALNTFGLYIQREIIILIRNLRSFITVESLIVVIASILFFTKLPESNLTVSKSFYSSLVSSQDNITHLSPQIHILLLFIFGFITSGILSRNRSEKAPAAIVLSVGIYLLTSLVLYQFGFQADIVVIPSILVFLFLLNAFKRYLSNKLIHDRVSEAFAQYVHPQVLEKILTDPSALELGGEDRLMTVMFSDIRNFTNISERINAQELISFLNGYFNRLGTTVLKHKGVIDKYVGDMIMAFWNAPIIDDLQASNACLTAMDMVRSLRRFNLKLKFLHSLPIIQIGVGINTGNIVVGNVGTSKRFDYTIIGDEVNVASRLEDLTKRYNVPIIISSKTIEQLETENTDKNFCVRQLDIVKVRGRDETLSIYQLMGRKDEKLELLKQQYEEAFSIYRNRDFDKASQSFVKILNETDDFPSKMMLVRCYNFIEERPNDEWMGEWQW